MPAIILHGEKCSATGGVCRLWRELRADGRTNYQFNDPCFAQTLYLICALAQTISQDRHTVRNLSDFLDSV